MIFLPLKTAGHGTRMLVRVAVRFEQSMQALLIENSMRLFSLQFKGDGFLRNMIRNLVGTLIEAGRGKDHITGICRNTRSQRQNHGRPDCAGSWFMVEEGVLLTVRTAA